jgi:flavodoxin
MKALIVYDSVYGNTEKIARAIAEAITPFGGVKVLRAGEANPSELASIDLLIVGSPTQGGRPTKAIQEFLDKIPDHTLRNISVTSFDTRVKVFIAKVFGYAAGRIADSLKGKGGHLVTPPEGFIVMGNEGPLKEGELERATIWAKGILVSKK